MAFVVPNCPQFRLSDLGIVFDIRPCHRHCKAWGGCRRMAWLTWDVYESSEREFDQHEYASLWECEPNFLKFLKLLFSCCLYYTESGQRQAHETQSSSTMITLLRLPNLKILITYGNCNAIKADSPFFVSHSTSETVISWWLPGRTAICFKCDPDGVNWMPPWSMVVTIAHLHI